MKWGGVDFIKINCMRFSNTKSKFYLKREHKFTTERLKKKLSFKGKYEMKYVMSKPMLVFTLMKLF